MKAAIYSVSFHILLGSRYSNNEHHYSKRVTISKVAAGTMKIASLYTLRTTKSASVWNNISPSRIEERKMVEVLENENSLCSTKYVV